MGGGDGNRYFIPDSATSDTGTPCLWAMNPTTEKMTQPLYKLVPLFTRANIMQSLQS